MTPSFPTRRSSCLGGAAIYVAEHAPTEKRGFYTSFIQASVIGGFLLSLIVVLLSGAFVDQGRWESWGWRIPFLFSLVLLAVSLWMRLKLKESPVFQAMKAAGETARNPLAESFATWANIKMVLVALFGQIGRAQCREGVCQYVSISVVAVSLKKKK